MTVPGGRPGPLRGSSRVLGRRRAVATRRSVRAYSSAAGRAAGDRGDACSRRRRGRRATPTPSRGGSTSSAGRTKRGWRRTCGRALDDRPARQQPGVPLPAGPGPVGASPTAAGGAAFGDRSTAGPSGSSPGTPRAGIAHHRRNYEFFGAPVGLILTTSAHARAGALVDAGLFLQALMLAAREYGLRHLSPGLLRRLPPGAGSTPRHLRRRDRRVRSRARVRGSGAPARRPRHSPRVRPTLRHLPRRPHVTRYAPAPARRVQAMDNQGGTRRRPPIRPVGPTIRRWTRRSSSPPPPAGPRRLLEDDARGHRRRNAGGLPTDAVPALAGQVRARRGRPRLGLPGPARQLSGARARRPAALRGLPGGAAPGRPLLLQPGRDHPAGRLHG